MPHLHHPQVFARLPWRTVTYDLELSSKCARPDCASATVCILLVLHHNLLEQIVSSCLVNRHMSTC